MSGFLKRNKTDTVNPAGGVNPASSPNVGQYGWTSYDAANVNQLIQYVNMAQEAAQSAKDSADYVSGKFGELQAFIDYIDVVYQEIGPIFANIDLIYKDIVLKHTEITSMHADTLKFSADAIASASAAKESEEKALVSEVTSAGHEHNAEINKDEAVRAAQEARDIAEELRKGQVYRGTWNLESNAKYPDAPDTNSVWDIVLNEGTLEYQFDSKRWFWGDRLLYLKDSNEFSQIESGSTVISVNGKSGAITLSASDVGAVDTSGDTMTGALRWVDDDKYVNGTGNSMYIASKAGRVYIEGASTPIARVGGVDYNMYHQGFKPTPDELGAVPIDGTERMTGVLNTPGMTFTGDDGNIINNEGEIVVQSTKRFGATLLGNDKKNTYIVFKNDLLARKGLTDYYVYHSGFKPTAADVGALSTSGGVINGETTIKPPQGSSPLNLHHNPIVSGANALGVMGWNSDGSTREWGAGMYYQDGAKQYAYMGKGEAPWTTGIKVYDDRVETPGNLIVGGGITCSRGLTISGFGNVQAMSGGFLRSNTEDVMSMDGKNYSFVTSPRDAHLCSNAYWNGRDWLKYDAANASMYAVVNVQGQFKLMASSATSTNPNELNPVLIDRVGNANFNGTITTLGGIKSTSGIDATYLQARNAGNPTVELHEPGVAAAMMYKPHGSSALRFAQSNGAGSEARGFGHIDVNGYHTVDGRFASNYVAADRGWVATGQNHFHGLPANVNGNGTLYGLLGKQVSYPGHWSLEQYLGTWVGTTNANDLAHVFVSTDGGGYLRQWFMYNDGRMQSPSSHAVSWSMAADGILHGSAYGGYGSIVQWCIASFAPVSDERLKTVIGRSTKSALDVVDQFQFKKFTWKEEAGEIYTTRDKKVTEIGLIAQEVEAIDPSLVKDVKLEGEDSVDVKVLDTNSLLSIALKAIQEQQAQIDELKEKLNEFILK